MILLDELFQLRSEVLRLHCFLLQRLLEIQDVALALLGLPLKVDKLLLVGGIGLELALTSVVELARIKVAAFAAGRLVLLDVFGLIAFELRVQLVDGHAEFADLLNQAHILLHDAHVLLFVDQRLLLQTLFQRVH